MMVEISSPSRNTDQQISKSLKESLEIRFVKCTFTYKKSHISDKSTSTKSMTLCKNRNGLAILRNRMKKVCEAVTQEKTFKNCTFVPTDEKEIKDFISKNISNFAISFEDCKFKERRSTWLEQLNRKLLNLSSDSHLLRLLFGIELELDVTEFSTYLKPSAKVKLYTFCAKDIELICKHIQSRVVNELPDKLYVTRAAH